MKLKVRENFTPKRKSKRDYKQMMVFGFHTEDIKNGNNKTCRDKNKTKQGRGGTPVSDLLRLEAFSRIAEIIHQSRVFQSVTKPIPIDLLAPMYQTSRRFTCCA